MPPPILALLSADTPDGMPVLTVRGELDVGTAPALRAWLNSATCDASRSAIVDLSAVTFMAAAALHALCDEHDRLTDADHRLTIVCQHPQLLALFELVAGDRHLHVVPTRPAPRTQPQTVPPGGRVTSWPAGGNDDLPPEAG
jgi:anti-anti-sigma factor